VLNNFVAQTNNANHYTATRLQLLRLYCIDTDATYVSLLSTCAVDSEGTVCVMCVYKVFLAIIANLAVISPPIDDLLSDVSPATSQRCPGAECQQSTVSHDV